MKNPPQSFDEIAQETLAFYDDQADLFIKHTRHINMNLFYEPFLALLPKGASILDVGCGSGRDSLYFHQNGCQVTAIDGSKVMVGKAREYTGLDVKHMKFQEIGFEGEFDGVWACASLLHVGRDQIDSVLEKLNRALKISGVLYLSFKYGQEEGWRNDRLFSDYDEVRLDGLLQKHPNLRLEKSWVTNDQRPDRFEQWLNALCVKRNESPKL